MNGACGEEDEIRQKYCEEWKVSRSAVAVLIAIFEVESTHKSEGPTTENDEEASVACEESNTSMLQFSIMLAL